MSRYRNIHVKMWTSDDFLALSAPKANARDLFIYLLTGPHTTAIPGIFVAGKARLVEELGWPARAWERCWSELETRWMARADWKARVVYLPGALKHNLPRTPNSVRSWREEWKLIPQCAVKDEAAKAFRAQFASMGEEFLRAWESVEIGSTTPVPGGFGPERSAEQSTERSATDTSERSAAQPPERSDTQPPEQSDPSRTRARAGARSPAPAPDPSPALSGSEGVQGEPPAVPDREDLTPVVRAILSALRSHPELRSVADAETAADLSKLAVEAGTGGKKRLSWIVAAIGRAAPAAKSATRDGATPGRLHRLVWKFCERANAEDELPPGSPPRRPTQGPAFQDLPEDASWLE